MGKIVFVDNIEELTLNNIFYRRVIGTTNYQQLVIMSVKPEEDIEYEIHPENDQFIRIEKGQGLLITGKNKENQYTLKDGSSFIIPAGTWHQIINTSSVEDLKLYTIYSPPHHPKDRIDINRPNSKNNKNTIFNRNQLI